METIKLPELGEGIDFVEVVAVRVKAGDSVQRDQTLIEVETEKATLEVPSTHPGTVAEVLVKAGDRVQVDQAIVKLETGSGAEADDASASESDSDSGETASGAKPSGSADTERPAASAESDGDAAGDEPDDGGAATRSDDGKTGSDVISFPVKAAAPSSPNAPAVRVPAAPSVRALAREIGVDIGTVSGSGPGGRISIKDVKAHAKRLLQQPQGGASAATAAPPLPDFSRWGEVERRPLGSVRRATAKHMANAWVTVPHVTQFDRADVTDLESMRKQYNRRNEDRGPKLTMTAIVIKGLATALRRHPNFNASIDIAAGEVVLKRYVHVGVAVDTERGLLVPVLRDADRKGLPAIASELDELATRARDRKLTPDEMQGASFTVSNLGGLGTTYFSPIVNWPEVAILGVGRAETTAVHREGRFEPRSILPLSLSYDHRLIDGADAARFLRWLAEVLEQPLLLLMDS